MSGPGASGAIVLTFQVPGLDAVTRSFYSAGKVVDDLTPVWSDIADGLAQDAMYNFVGEGGMFSFGFTRVVGSAWAPLAASTNRDRVSKGYPPAHPILVRTGELEASLITRGGAGNITDIQPLGMRFGTSVPYAAFHQFGTSKMPARPILGMTRDRQAMIVRAVGDYIRQQVRAQF